MRWKKGIVYCLFFLICVLGTLIFFQNYQYVDYVIDLRKFSVLEIVLSITLVPCLIDEYMSSDILLWQGCWE